MSKTSACLTLKRMGLSPEILESRPCSRTSQETFPAPTAAAQLTYSSYGFSLAMSQPKEIRYLQNFWSTGAGTGPAVILLHYATSGATIVSMPARVMASIWRCSGSILHLMTLLAHLNASPDPSTSKSSADCRRMNLRCSGGSPPASSSFCSAEALR